MGVQRGTAILQRMGVPQWIGGGPIAVRNGGPIGDGGSIGDGGPLKNGSPIRDGGPNAIRDGGPIRGWGSHNR